MTTYIDFTPNVSENFQFQVTLDNNIYNCTVTTNLFGNRYFLNIFDQSGTLVLTKAMGGSPVGFDISLVWGLFTSTLVYREDNAQFEINP